MLIRAYDAAFNDEEWKEFLLTHDFGELIASGRNREIPVVVPTHFVFDGDESVVLHLARANPLWPAIAENPVAVMSVFGAYAYIPTTVNASESEPEGYGVPTSYYAAVQVSGPCEIIDDAGELAKILNHQLEHFDCPEAHHEVEPGDNPYALQMSGIRGLRLSVAHVRAKFKFGNNKTPEHRMAIASYLQRHEGKLEGEARSHLLRRLESSRR